MKWLLIKIGDLLRWVDAKVGAWEAALDEKKEEERRYYELAARVKEEDAALEALTPEERAARRQAQQEEDRKRYEAMMEENRKRAEEEERLERIKMEDYQNHPAMAYESFLKRACSFEQPFVLKGGFALRHYFEEAVMRYSNDIDWVYAEPLDSQSHARTVFNEWLDRIINTQIEGDRVKFRKWDHNFFWETLDYANEEDFPTTSTELIYFIDNSKYRRGEIKIQISFNLELTYPPVSFVYKPYHGEPFTVPQAVSLPVQVGWKLHQTLYRPRFKDIFDLTHLLKHPEFDKEALQIAIQELVNECAVDGERIGKLRWFITDKAAHYMHLLGNTSPENPEIKQLEEEAKKDGIYLDAIQLSDYHYISRNTDTPPQSLEGILRQFQEELNKAGFTEEMFATLPAPNRKKRVFPNPDSRD